jgi:hypothetical protein
MCIKLTVQDWQRGSGPGAPNLARKKVRQGKITQGKKAKRKKVATENLLCRLLFFGFFVLYLVIILWLVISDKDAFQESLQDGTVVLVVFEAHHLFDEIFCVRGCA